MELQTWDIRSTDGGANGLPFARATMAACSMILAHSLPASVDVEVRDSEGRFVATAHDLKDGEPTPMALLEIDGEHVRRTQLWPSRGDIGTPVILPGGEVGILTAWWHAPDHSEWRWSIELHNHA